MWINTFVSSESNNILTQEELQFATKLANDRLFARTFQDDATVQNWFYLEARNYQKRWKGNLMMKLYEKFMSHIDAKCATEPLPITQTKTLLSDLSTNLTTEYPHTTCVNIKPEHRNKESAASLTTLVSIYYKQILWDTIIKVSDVQALLLKETNYGTCDDMDVGNGAGYFQLTPIGTAGVIEYIRRHKSEYTNLLKGYHFCDDIPWESSWNKLTQYCRKHTQRRTDMTLNTILGMIHIKMNLMSKLWSSASSIVNKGFFNARKMAKDQGLNLNTYITAIQKNPEKYAAKLKTFFSYNGNKALQNEYAVFCVAAAEHIKAKFYSS